MTRGKSSKISRPKAVRRSIRITPTSHIHESDTEEQEQELILNETRGQATRVNETNGPETQVNETSEQQNRPKETREQDTCLNDQENRSPTHETTNDEPENQTDEPVRTRGPNHGADIPENQDDRPTIIAIGGRFPDSRVTSDITVMLRSHFDGPWPTWSKVPENIKKNLWAKFTKHYKWSSWRHYQIRKAWETTNSNRLRDILCEERKHAEILANSTVPANWKNRNPDWIPRRYWNMLIDNVWSTDKWQKKSTSGKQNRIKGNDRAEPTYTGGSISIAAHKMKMRKELNRDPTELELYDRTHKTNRGTGDYVCAKAKKVREDYEMLIEKTYPDPETRPSFDRSLWSKACGGLSSRRGVEAHIEWSDMRDGSLGGEEEFDKKIIDVEKIVEDLKLKTESSIKETKDEIVKFKTELPEMLRTMLQELQWTNMKYAGGSGRHQQSYAYVDEYDDNDDDVYSDEYNDGSGDDYDRVLEMPRKHRVYGNRYDQYYDDDGAGYKKSKDNDGKKRPRSNGKNVQQSRKHKK